MSADCTELEQNGLFFVRKQISRRETCLLIWELLLVTRCSNLELGEILGKEISYVQTFY